MFTLISTNTGRCISTNTGNGLSVAWRQHSSAVLRPTKPVQPAYACLYPKFDDPVAALANVVP